MMKRTISKFFGASALALSLTLLPSALPAGAQTSTSQDGPTMDTTPFQESDNDFNNLGWLGLLGLIGLANLFRKPKPTTTETYSDPQYTNRT